MGVSKYGIKVSTSDQYVSDSQQTVFFVRVEKFYFSDDLCDQNVTSGFKQNIKKNQNKTKKALTAALLHVVSPQGSLYFPGWIYDKNPFLLR